MSRIGRMPIQIPAGVTVTVGGDNTVVVKGSKHTLSYKVNPLIGVNVENNAIHLTRADDENKTKALHGLSRSLIANMVHGVEKDFTKELEINGVGYKAAKQGKQLVLNVGYSHQVFVDERDDVKIDVPAPNKIVVSGPDKQAVGQLAAEIRSIRPPEPYLGKGIKYATEVIRRKEGKTAAKKK
jgi:large subunit ribosomal protein L6